LPRSHQFSAVRAVLLDLDGVRYAEDAPLHREEAVRSSGGNPDATVDSIADVPRLLLGAEAPTVRRYRPRIPGRRVRL